MPCHFLMGLKVNKDGSIVPLCGAFYPAANAGATIHDTLLVGCPEKLCIEPANLAHEECKSYRCGKILQSSKLTVDKDKNCIATIMEEEE